MKLLLDSHILIWWAGGSRRLGAKARDLIVASESELYMSAASWWELAIKSALGRLDFDAPKTRKEIEKRGVTAIAITISHAEAAAALPRLHGDPFDHMLVAQAQSEGMILLTRDRRLEAYGSPVFCV